MTKIENLSTLPPKYLAEAITKATGNKVSTQAMNKKLAVVGFQEKNLNGSGWLVKNTNLGIQCGRSYKNGKQEAVQWLPEVLQDPLLMNECHSHRLKPLQPLRTHEMRCIRKKLLNTFVQIFTIE